MLLRCFLVVVSAILLASCGNDLNVISKERALGGKAIGGFKGWSGSASYSSDAPSPSVIARGNAYPKDKHGMPFYGTRERVRFVRTTAYHCREADHLEYGSLNATGTNLKYDNRVRSAAADWSVYPVGTVFKIKGMSQLYVVDDYGSALTGTGTIDLYTPSKAHMDAWGRRNVEISVVQWGSFERGAKILSKRTGYSHCRQMYANIQRRLGNTGTAMR